MYVCYAAAAAARSRSEASVRASFVHTQGLKYKHNTRTYRDFEGLEWGLKYKKVITLHYKSSERAKYLSILGNQPLPPQIITSSFLKAQPLLFSCSGSEINHPNLCVKLRRSTLAQNLAAAHRRQRNSWAKQLGQLRTPHPPPPSSLRHGWRRGGGSVRSHYSLSQSETNHTLKNWRLKHSTTAAAATAAAPTQYCLAAARRQAAALYCVLAAAWTKTLVASRHRALAAAGKQQEPSHHHHHGSLTKKTRVRCRLLRRGNDRCE